MKNHEPQTILLNEFGRIVDSCESIEHLFGFRHSELVGQHISKLFPQLSEYELLLKDNEIDPHLGHICYCGFSFQSKTRDGSTFKSELHFVNLSADRERCTIRLLVLPYLGAE